jgi:hypothetical protein
MDIRDHGANRRRNGRLQLAMGIAAVGSCGVPFDLLDARSNHSVEKQRTYLIIARWHTGQE